MWAREATDFFGEPGFEAPVNDDADPDHPVVSIAEKSKYIRQYTRYIRPAAVRIEAPRGQRVPVETVNR